MKLSRNFYAIPWGTNHFEDESDSSKNYLRGIFRGFSTRQEAEKYAREYNEDFILAYEDASAWVNDLSSKEVIVIKKEEVQDYLGFNFDYLGDDFED